MADLQNLADGIGKLANALPDAYADGAKGTVQQTGKVIERVPRLINALAADFDIWLMKREAKVAAVSKIIDKKLECIAEECIVSPEPYVAVPALQNISYSMESVELQDLYANLLAKSMVSFTKDYVHPSYVDIIRSMSPIDAENLKIIFGSMCPIGKTLLCTYTEELNLRSAEADISKGPIFLENETCSDTLASISLLNLERFGLVRFDYDRCSLDSSKYEAMRNTPTYHQCLETHRAMTNKHTRIELAYGLVVLTAFGSAFCDVCVKEINAVK